MKIFEDRCPSSHRAKHKIASGRESDRLVILLVFLFFERNGYKFAEIEEFKRMVHSSPSLEENDISFHHDFGSSLLRLGDQSVFAGSHSVEDCSIQKAGYRLLLHCPCPLH